MRQAPIPSPALERPAFQPQPPAPASRSGWALLGVGAVVVAGWLLWPRPHPPAAAPAPTLAHARELVKQRAYTDAVGEGKRLLQLGCDDPRAVRVLVAQAAVKGGLWEEAVAQYQLLGQTAELKKARRGLGQARLKAAQQALAAGNVVAARDLGKQALALLKGDRSLKASTCAVLGQAAYLLDQLPEARNYLSQASDATSRATLAKVEGRLAPPPARVQVADYVKPAAPREDVVVILPSNARQPAYPTYQPQRSGLNDPLDTLPPRYVEPARPQQQVPRFEPETYPTPRPTYSRSPSSEVGRLRQSESLLHR